MKISTISLLVGLAICSLGYLYLVMFVGVPYQDPTPTLQGQQNFHMLVGNTMLVVGMVLFVVTLLYKIVNLLLKLARSR